MIEGLERKEGGGEGGEGGWEVEEDEAEWAGREGKGAKSWDLRLAAESEEKPTYVFSLLDISPSKLPLVYIRTGFLPLWETFFCSLAISTFQQITRDI